MIAHIITTTKHKSTFAKVAKYVVDARGGIDPATWTRTTDYILDTKSQGDGEKVGSVRVTNCLSDDPADAALEIIATQAKNKRSKADKHYHIVFSFPPGETVDVETLHKIEDELCASIGLADHQRVSAVHLDTEKLHVHIAINKVHPRTFRNVEPYYPKNRLMEACERLEIKFDLQRTNHGKNAQDKVHGRASDMEAFSGEQSLLGWIKESAGAELIACRETGSSWQDMHNALNKHGLEVRLRGAGLVIGVQGDKKLAVKASSVDRSLAFKGLTERWGPYVPPADNEQVTTQEATALAADEQTQTIQTFDEVQSYEDYGQREYEDREFDPDEFAAVYESYSQEFGERPPAETLDDLRELSSVDVVSFSERSEVLLPPDAPGELEFGGAQPIDSVRRGSGGEPGQAGGTQGEGREENPGRAQGPAATGEGGKQTRKTGQRTETGRGAEDPQRLSEASYSKRPLHKHEGTSGLYTEYQRKREAAQLARVEFRKEHGGELARYGKTLSAWYREKRKLVKTNPQLSSEDRRFAYSELKKQREADFDVYREGWEKLRVEVLSKHPLPTWQEFCQQEADKGNAVAQSVLRSRAYRQARMAGDLLTAEDAEEARSIVFQHLKPRTMRNGSTVYQVEDGGVVSDERQAVRVKELTAGASFLALALADERFKGRRLIVEGSEEFKSQVVSHAALKGLDVRFADPAMEAERNRLVETRAPDAPTSSTALEQLVAERNSKREKISSIDYHRAWSPADAGKAVYLGRRKLKDGSEAVLLKRGDVVLVKGISSVQAAKASRWKVGQVVHMDARGRFIDSTRTKKR
ncbi:relaxase/mobilization nuclease domain-containing protein (plasmid) [Pseudomonas viciae]|uniref:Relaxase/mobilization nuclease domain-containing protein n=1 Tax=Pseudomonas viciae TaxID=2505979 RepID=A0ABY8PMC6_9PSED|nr:TraI/MobA(P) family conjugative relaxase [Pseudomonas viciae]WGO96399.1 relaxase/mobilization nuclease domain-containing protein [Pseudomonas viciae]